MPFVDPDEVTQPRAFVDPDAARPAVVAPTPADPKYFWQPGYLDQQRNLARTNRGVQFGGGAANAAYDAGAKITDITGSPAAGYATNVAMQAVPALFGGNIMGSAAIPAMQNTARSLMQSAVKPTWETLRTGEAQRGVETMLKEGISPTQAGANKLQSMIDELNNQVQTAIAGSGAKISKDQIASYLTSIADRFGYRANPQAALDAVDAAKEAFLNHPLLRGAQDLPVQLAQKMKQATYSGLRDSYGELKGAEIESQKALARGMKEEISKAVPEVGPLNAREGELINALDIAERRALMEGNKNPGGLSLIAPSKEAIAGFLADRSAAAKALLARMLYSQPAALPMTAGTLGILGASHMPQPQLGILNQQ